jgi:hypothetical protein
MAAVWRLDSDVCHDPNPLQRAPGEIRGKTSRTSRTVDRALNSASKASERAADSRRSSMVRT